MELKALIFVLMCISAAVNWYFAARLNLKAYYVTKPFPMVFLILWFYIQTGWRAPAVPFLIGFILSLAGDIALTSRNRTAFLTGVLFFFLAHLAYIQGFRLKLFAPELMGAGLIALSLLVLALVALPGPVKPKANLPRTVRIGMMAYAVILILMFLFASATFWKPNWPREAAVMAAFGAALFVISDGMIALNKAHKVEKDLRFWIISTYHLAQFLIAMGVIRWFETIQA